MPKLFVIYDLNPEKVFTKIIEPKDSIYAQLLQANGCYVNGNTSDYPETVVDAVANLSENMADREHNKAEIEGYFKVVKCGFYC